MTIITCISDVENPGYVYGLKASCNYFGLNLMTLVTADNSWETHRNKDTELHRALLGLPLDEIVLFTDGYDTFFIGNEKEIIIRYDSARDDKNLLITAEKCCFPATFLSDEFKSIPSEFKYVNSGGIIGNVESFLNALDEISIIQIEEKSKTDAFPFSNQYLWMLYYIRNKESIALDYQCKLFQALTPNVSTFSILRDMEEDIDKRQSYVKKEFEKVNKDFQINGLFNFKNKLTGNYPIHLHFNSPISKFGMFQKPYLSWIEHFNS